jgi:hypothetical protein
MYQIKDLAKHTDDIYTAVTREHASPLLPSGHQITMALSMVQKHVILIRAMPPCLSSILRYLFTPYVLNYKAFRLF